MKHILMLKTQYDDGRDSLFTEELVVEENRPDPWESIRLIDTLYAYARAEDEPDEERPD